MLFPACCPREMLDPLRRPAPSAGRLLGISVSRSQEWMTMSESTATMDPTFYRSPAEAIAAPKEQLAYVVAFDRAGERPDALTVVDVDENSAGYGTVVGWVDLPTTGDELHHFGWNACSSALKHEGHDMGTDGLQRRYLLLPGLRSSSAIWCSAPRSTVCRFRPSDRSQKWSWWPYFPPSSSSGTSPSSIIEGVPHSLDTRTFCLRCHQAS